MKEAEFRELIYTYYAHHKRVFPWRQTHDPYAILVSEIMLQQTQAGRSIPKYEEFLSAFPTVETLAQASTHDVLMRWQGLGYNRRGLYLRDTARIILNEYSGLVPKDVVLLDSLPGIGFATACAIATYAYSIPTVFIETNIRTVFLHFFFKDKMDVHDNEILPLVEKYLDRDNPRDWYYALMDYGVYLKKELKFTNAQSRHYGKQSKFAGSVRQVRGEVIRQLTKRTLITIDSLRDVGFDSSKLHDALVGLERDSLIVRDRDTLRLKD